ncbi:hypothetical protein FRC06_001488 [Ceratobasidium sp. 370]|nr:hypothetical protein FRC06_001488 [Ceratobasidium sp. 370]
MVPKLECWVDASTKPACIAILINKSFITFGLKDGWDKKKGMDNNWAETVGLELAARVMVALGHSGICVRVRSDSFQAISAFHGTKCKLQASNESMDRLRTLLKRSNVTMDCVQVTSKENIADAFTRGRVGAIVACKSTSVASTPLKEFQMRRVSGSQAPFVTK